MDAQQFDQDLTRAVELARHARNIEVFTGAGMSADSGLNTFRDAQTGLWSKVDPQAMASIDSWARDPEPMWAWYLWRARLALEAEPNPGHRALGDWSELAGVDEVHVTTQNIDNLHERGGADDVAHLHGSLFDFHCTICSRPWRGEVEYPAEPVERLRPPECPLCGNLIRPGVVWFGEALPQREWQVAEEKMRRADLVVVVGTSGVVYPAASLPMLAYRQGTPVLEVSPAATELSGLSTVSWRSTAAAALPALVSALRD